MPGKDKTTKQKTERKKKLASKKWINRRKQNEPTNNSEVWVSGMDTNREQNEDTTNDDDNDKEVKRENMNEWAINNERILLGL